MRFTERGIVLADAEFRIFSYLPNPRVWKSLITADLCGVQVDVIGDKPARLSQWLWDYEARLLPPEMRGEESVYARTGRRGFSGTLYKTDAFLRAQPFGTVPCAFGPSGHVGLFESNSILRAVARAGSKTLNLYGDDIYSASRIDGFLDANLVFAREVQVYLLSIEDLSSGAHERMVSAYEFYLSGIESALGHGQWISGDTMSIADISFVCDFAQCLRDRFFDAQLQSQGFSAVSSQCRIDYPRAVQHMLTLCDTPAFKSHMGDYLDAFKTAE